MSPEAEALDKELRRIHAEPLFPLPRKSTWAEIIGGWIFTALSVLILMAMGGAITVAYLSYHGWIQFASL